MSYCLQCHTFHQGPCVAPEFSPAQPAPQEDAAEKAAREWWHRSRSFNSGSIVESLAPLVREREAAARLEGAQRMLDMVRGSLVGWPHTGSDIEVAKEVQRIEAAAFRRGAEAMRELAAKRCERMASVDEAGTCSEVYCVEGCFHGAYEEAAENIRALPIPEAKR